MFLSGCLHGPSYSKLLAPGGTTLVQHGDANIPATASEKTTVAVVPLPAETKVSFDAGSPLPIFTLGTASTATVKTTETQLKAATPPQPPKPEELASAKGVLIYYAIGAALALVAVVCFYEAHVKAGVICLIGAVVVPLLARAGEFVAAHFVIVAVICLAGALVAAWYFIADKHVDVLADAATLAKTESAKLETAVKTVV